MLTAITIYAVLATLLWYHTARENIDLKVKLDGALVLTIREHCKKNTLTEDASG